MALRVYAQQVESVPRACDSEQECGGVACLEVSESRKNECLIRKPLDRQFVESGTVGICEKHIEMRHSLVARHRELVCLIFRARLREVIHNAESADRAVVLAD